MCFEGCLMNLSLMFTHPLRYLILKSSLFYLCIKHLRVISLSLLLYLLHIPEPLLFSERIHPRLLQHHPLDLLISLLWLIMHVDLFIKALMNKSPTLSSLLQFIYVSRFQLFISFLLVNMFIDVVESIFLRTRVNNFSGPLVF